MSRIAFIYPGQGAQTTGMGKDFYEQSESFREKIDQGSEWLGVDLKKLCFEPNDLLDRTDYTQIAMVSVCAAMTQELLCRGVEPVMTAGLSLGEYAAICAAGGMSYRDALETVWLRGRLMHQSMQEGRGGMAAVLGLTGEEVEEAIRGIAGVSIANYNCPGQIVITGEKDALYTAQERLKEAKAKRVMALRVSGPFHSPYMKEAGERLLEKLESISWKELRIPYVANVHAEPVRDCSEISGLLKEQVSSPVRWEQSVRRMLEEGIDTFVEIGPGRTLAGFLSRIDRTVKVYSIHSTESMHAFLRDVGLE